MTRIQEKWKSLQEFKRIKKKNQVNYKNTWAFKIIQRIQENSKNYEELKEFKRLKNAREFKQF